MGKNENRVASDLDTMLKAMGRRGPRIQSHITRTESVTIGIGICDEPAYSPSRGFLSDRHKAVAIDGFFYDEGLINGKLCGTDPRGFAELLALPGAFSFVSAEESGLLAGRDPVGQKPLYFGAGSEGTVTCASLKAGLEAIGVEKPQPVPLGTVLVASGKGFKALDSSNQLTEPSETAVNEAEAVSVLQELFIEAVSKGVPIKSGIAFSGGLDSSLVAAAAKECGKDPELVTVGTTGQPELDHAHAVATELGLPITILEVTPSEILDSLADVILTVESTDPVVVGVSIPFYLACRKAKEMGRNVIVAGQLSDELFGGYARFEKLVAKGMHDQARAEIWKSVLAAPTNDFEPGDKVAVSLGLEMRCPFAYLPLVKSALQLPLSMKLRVSEDKTTRKYALRKLAKRMKLPDSVVERPKKAVQYSSGVQKILRKEARRRSLGVNEFLHSFVN